MSDVARPSIIAGNWKMYKTAEEATSFIQEIAPQVADCSRKVYLSVPFTLIQPAVALATKLQSSLVIGAQNMNDASEGAFTGEIAASMLKEAGARFVLLGHSERRHLFGEKDAFINRKVLRALKEGLQPILCVGETLAQREKEETEKVLEEQIVAGLADVHPEDAVHLILAYEPVWAIGTGRTATAAVAEKAHQFCRNILKKFLGENVARATPILYGGSVKADNAAELLAQKNIDGLLVGGASLSSEQFSKIIHCKKGDS